MTNTIKTKTSKKLTKPIRVDYEVWKKLWDIKLKENLSSLNEVIKMLIDLYHNRLRGFKGGV